MRATVFIRRPVLFDCYNRGTHTGTQKVFIT